MSKPTGAVESISQVGFEVGGQQLIAYELNGNRIARALERLRGVLPYSLTELGGFTPHASPELLRTGSKELWVVARAAREQAGIVRLTSEIIGVTDPTELIACDDLVVGGAALHAIPGDTMHSLRELDRGVYGDPTSALSHALHNDHFITVHSINPESGLPL